MPADVSAVSFDHMHRLLSIASFLSGVSLVGLLAYANANDSGHTSFEPYLLAGLFVATAAASLLAWWNRKRITPAIAFTGVLALAGLVTVIYLDQTNMLVQYERWLRRGMPAKGGKSNKPAAGTAGIAPQLTIEQHRPGVPEPER
jgi:uncharacterized membrane protein AbrB (regulator of aidB expression)